MLQFGKRYDWQLIDNFIINIIVKKQLETLVPTFRLTSGAIVKVYAYVELVLMS